MLSSNPDIDYPANRVFWESDEQFSRRFEIMREKRERLKEIEGRRWNLQSVLDGEMALSVNVERFKDTVYGYIGDGEFKKALDFGLYLQRRIESHKNLNNQMHEQIKALRKELSELTR